jgi:hypothetical protein
MCSFIVAGAVVGADTRLLSGWKGYVDVRSDDEEFAWRVWM